MYIKFVIVMLLNTTMLKVCDRIPWIRNRKVLVGCLFGMLAVVANTLTFDISSPVISSSFVDVPMMTAGFFYGTVPGLIAGLIAAAFQPIILYWSCINYWWIASLIILTLTGFSILTRLFFLADQRPNLVSGILCMAFGECIRLFVCCLCSSPLGGDAFFLVLSRRLIHYHLLFAIAGTVMVIAARSWGTIRSNLLNKLILIFILFDLGCFGIFAVSVVYAKRDAEQTLMNAGITLHKSFLDQARYMLRNSAACFANSEPGLRNFTHEQVKKLAKKTGFDEINIYDHNGELVESNSDAVLKANRRLVYTPVREGPLRKNSIMETGFDRGPYLNPTNVFRVVTPFADGSGYYEIGLIEELLYVDYEIMLIPLLKDRSIGKDGFFVTTTSNGQIVIPVIGRPELLGKNIHNLGVTQAHLAGTDYDFFSLIFNGQWHFCLKFKTNAGITVFTFLPARETFSSYLSQACISCLLLLTLLFLAQITLQSLVSAWKKVESAQQEKLQMVHKNLEMARNIQMDELRNDDINEENGRVSCFIQPAEAVGGDFYDYFHLKNGLKVFVIGDVSGEGIPAALFMMKAKTAIRENIRTTSSLVDAVTTVNQYLCRHNSSFMFVTLWIAFLDLSTGMSEYICAGHNPPLWTHKGREAEWLPGTHSPALGASSRSKFFSRTIQLKPGDGIFLYTDGVTEAKNSQEELFTPERLKNVISSDDAELHIQNVYTEIKKFTEYFPQSDDITMLEIVYLGNKQSQGINFSSDV